ncbi:MAG: methylisocitrate lyase [Chloroflexi bacterium]|jgi:methylisocitrate lyase|uniref:2-methylisocitrate lyase n=1 Tax=Candidatus Thermofonsia Clade 3 bacterium TaxID=2364212 RepID=A0A2M8QET9_9CHLR|nr:methylisocitrate lyase [Candidatus Roseilinea sp. NK_OTU-006]PJF48278.1 MAG: methylisocitrate lyase [Candidatus Thermofonsia Clade 3 bacterium]RMG66268.1 MAG: methylisocitrate lyase [Chloroflexota bacterium]
MTHEPLRPKGPLWAALAAEQPLQIVGASTAYHALLARRAGFRALHLSGAGVSMSSLGAPDLGIIALEDVLIDARRITDACDLPLLVDVDTGFGSAFNIARTVKALIKAGAAGLHIEDQVQAKRCGHRPGKAIVSKAEMVDRIKAAVDARTDAGFVIMARTDALAIEGLEAAIERAVTYIEAGADMIFPEAMTEPVMYRRFKEAAAVPVLANANEFGLTPLFTAQQFAAHGVDMVLYPISAFRAASRAALAVYETIRRDGVQTAVLSLMQPQDELYAILDYEAYERKLDTLFAAGRA